MNDSGKKNLGCLTATISVTVFLILVLVGYGALGLRCFLIGMFVALCLFRHAYLMEAEREKKEREEKEREEKEREEKEREEKEREEKEKKALIESRREKYMPLYLQALSATGITDKKNIVRMDSGDGSNDAIKNESKTRIFYIWRDSSNLCLFPCGISGNPERDEGSRLLNQIAELDEADFSKAVKVIKIPLSKISRFIQKNEILTESFTNEFWIKKIERQAAIDANARGASVPIPPPRYNTSSTTTTKQIVDLIFKDANGKELTAVFKPTSGCSEASDDIPVEVANNNTGEFDDIFNSLIPEKSSCAEDATPPKARNTTVLPQSKTGTDMTDEKMIKAGITMNDSQLAEDIQVKVDDIQRRIDWIIGKISKQINTQAEFDKLFETFQSIVPDMMEAKQMIADLHKQNPTSKIGLKLENQLCEQAHDIEDIMDAFTRVIGG